MVTVRARISVGLYDSDALSAMARSILVAILHVLELL